jgi:hypothetical protein
MKKTGFAACLPQTLWMYKRNSVRRYRRILNSKTSLIHKIDKAKIKVCKYAVQNFACHFFGFLSFGWLEYSTKAAASQAEKSKFLQK